MTNIERHCPTWETICTNWTSFKLPPDILMVMRRSTPFVDFCYPIVLKLIIASWALWQYTWISQIDNSIASCPPMQQTDLVQSDGSGLQIGLWVSVCWLREELQSSVVGPFSPRVVVLSQGSARPQQLPLHRGRHLTPIFLLLLKEPKQTYIWA